MSIKAVRGAFDCRDGRLTSTERFVLLCFAEHANADTLLSWPSVGTVAAETGLGDSTVARALTKLRTLGYLNRRAKQRVGEHAWVWVYEVRTSVEDLSEREVVDAEDLSERERGPLGNDVEDLSERETNRKEEPEVTNLCESPDGASQAAMIETSPPDEPSKPVNLDRERRNRVWDSLVAGWGWVGPLTASARGQIARASKELREIGATPDEITERAERFARARRRRPSPIELVRDWGMYAPQPGEGSREPWLWK